ncbi:MAG: serine protease [bacterium]
MNKKLILLFILCAVPVAAQGSSDISTLLMKATFKISGPKSQGTCFIIGRPIHDNPKRARYVLVTANHVLAGISGDTASLSLRKKVNDDYTKVEWHIRIREKNKPLWIKHPDADVAVMYVSLPNEAEIVLLPMNFLVTDVELKKYEIRPADRLLALGFPFGQEANPAGFPILRSGIIASYPILPTKKTKSMLFDFEVFPGNSGGPVFMIEKNRAYGGGIHVGVTQFIVGLVSQERIMNIRYQTPFEQKLAKHPLKLGIIIHASLIKKAIEMLPEPKAAQPKDSGDKK